MLKYLLFQSFSNLKKQLPLLKIFKIQGGIFLGVPNAFYRDVFV